MFVYQHNCLLHCFFSNFCTILVFVSFLGFNIYFFVLSEYKKAKQDLKKATAETNKWQKKVKKGELGEHNKLYLKSILCV